MTPLDPVTVGEFNNDAGHQYNISVNVTMTNSQFFSILAYISNNSGMSYNLNTNNCTSFVLNAMRSAGIYLPSTVGYWLNGSGNNPGDLGEDIRTMSLAPNMSRTVSSTSHPNLGTCY